MQRYWRDLVLAGVLLCLPLLLFAPVALGNKTLLPADILYSFQPYRAAAEIFTVKEPQNALLADLILENYVWKQFLVESVKTRELPLWDPYLFAGHPFLANGQHAALYPLTWIFFLFRIERAFGLFITLQLGLAGISMYILGRTLGATRVGAFLSGITFQFSGFMIASVVHPMIVSTAAWLPLMLALVDRIVLRARFLSREKAMLPWALLGAMTVGLQFFAGHAEATYFSLLVTAAFAVWRLGYRMLTLTRDRWRADILSPVFGIILMLGIGLTLGAAQWLPLYEVVRTSFRQGAVSLADVLGWAYPKRRIIAFLVPNFFGNPAHHAFWDFFSQQTVSATVNAYGDPISAFDWGIKNYVEGAAYLGILPLLLVAVAILKPPYQQHSKTMEATQPAALSRVFAYAKRWFIHPYIPFFTLLSLFSLACVFGTPLYGIIYALPFLGQSHSPFRWVFPLTVAVAALAGLGATTVTELRKTLGPERADDSQTDQRVIPQPTNGQANNRLRSDKHSLRKTLAWLERILLFNAAPNAASIVGALAIWGGALMLGGIWGSRLIFSRIEPLVERVFRSLALAPNAFPDHRAFYAYLFPWLQAAATFLLGSGIVLRVSRCPIYLPKWLGRQPVWSFLAVAVLLGDLLAFGTGFNPAVDPALLNYTPPVIEFLKEDTGLWRLTTFDPQGRKTLNANTAMFYNFYDVRGYDSLFPAQYARYMGWIEPQGELLYNRIAPFTQFSSLDSPLTDMLNVKYIVTEEEIPLPKYERVYEDEVVRVYKNLGVMPRAFTLPDSATLVVSSVDAVGNAIQSYDPRYYVIIEDGTPRDAPGWTGPGERWKPTNSVSEAGTSQAQNISHYGANEIIVEVTIDEPSWLVLSDTYFPGWKAFVRVPDTDQSEETEVAITRVAGNFRGVYLEESAIVRFKYSPNSVKFGAFISFASAMGIIFFSVVWIWRLVYRGQDEQTAVRRLAKNSIAPIILTLFNRGLDFALAAFALRILGPANAGDYTYAITIFGWFEILTNFGLDAYLTREVSRHRDKGNRYLLNVTTVRLGLSAIGIPVLVGFIALSQIILTEPASRQTIITLLLLYLGLVPGSISKGLSSLFYAYEKAEYPAAISTVSTLIKITLQTIVLLLGWGIVGLAGASIVINIATLIILSVTALRLFPAVRGTATERIALTSNVARGLRREMINESWPLMINHLLATLFFKSDIFLLKAFLGSTAVGLYSTGYKYLDSLMVIPSMFTMALFPLISRQAKDDKEGFLRFYRLGVKLLISIALPAVIIANLVGREMILILGGTEYLPGAKIALQLMSWSMLIGWINSLTQYVLIALDQQRYLTRAFLIGFSFNLIANVIFIPRYGYPASAIIHTFSELALFIPFAIGLQKQLTRLNWWHILGKWIIAGAAMGAVALLLLPISRWVALTGALIVYPLVAWRIGLLTPEEQAMLTPLFKRDQQAAPVS